MIAVLLIIFNFIVIIGLISLISSKLTKYVINKFTITNDTIDHIKKILMLVCISIIPLNSILTNIGVYGESSIKFILMGIIIVVDIGCAICLSSFSKLLKKLNNTPS